MILNYNSLVLYFSCCCCGFLLCINIVLYYRKPFNGAKYLLNDSVQNVGNTIPQYTYVQTISRGRRYDDNPYICTQLLTLLDTTITKRWRQKYPYTCIHLRVVVVGNFMHDNEPARSHRISSFTLLHVTSIIICAHVCLPAMYAYKHS